MLSDVAKPQLINSDEMYIFLTITKSRH